MVPSCWLQTHVLSFLIAVTCRVALCTPFFQVKTHSFVLSFATRNVLLSFEINSFLLLSFTITQPFFVVRNTQSFSVILGHDQDIVLPVCCFFKPNYSLLALQIFQLYPFREHIIKKKWRENWSCIILYLYQLKLDFVDVLFFFFLWNWLQMYIQNYLIYMLLNDE